MVQHGLIQLALKTATEAPYQIKPSSTAARGYIVWHIHPKVGWQSIAQFNSRDLAEDFVVSQIAVLGEFV